MYTNYPNTEQITPKNDPKGSTQHLGELSFSPLAEVLQVQGFFICHMINYTGAWCNMIWSGESSFCCLLLVAHVKSIPEKQMLVFLTGHRHLFFLI